jgi:hypothetical protein
MTEVVAGCAKVTFVSSFILFVDQSEMALQTFFQIKLLRAEGAPVKKFNFLYELSNKFI